MTATTTLELPDDETYGKLAETLGEAKAIVFDDIPEDATHYIDLIFYSDGMGIYCVNQLYFDSEDKAYGFWIAFGETHINGKKDHPYILLKMCLITGEEILTEDFKEYENNQQ